MLPETLQYQKTLADYCRSGTLEKPLPGITPDRLPHYRRLVSNIFYDALERVYPIARRLLSEEEWEALVSDFSVKHDCTTPQVWRMPFEFYEFIKASDYAQTLKKPYLNDLLLFEWTEVEVYCMPDIPEPKARKTGNFKTNAMVFNPEYELLQLEYPVLMTTDEASLKEKGLYHLLIFRDYEDRSVHFINLSVFMAVFVACLLEDEPLLEKALKKTCNQLSVKISEKEETQLEGFLESLKNQKFILGFRD